MTRSTLYKYQNTHFVLILWSNSLSPSGLTRAELRDLKLRLLNASLYFCDSLPKFNEPPRDIFDVFTSPLAVSVLVSRKYFRFRANIWWHSESDSAPISSTLLPFCRNRLARDGRFFGMPVLLRPPPLDSWLASLQYDDDSSPDFRSRLKLGLCAKKCNGLLRFDCVWCWKLWCDAYCRGLNRFGLNLSHEKSDITFNSLLLIDSSLVCGKMLPYGLVGMGDGGVDIVRMSTHFNSFTFWLMCGKSNTCGPLMTTPSRFCRFRRLDLIDSTRRNNALAPSLRRSLPVRRNRTGWSWSLCDCEKPSGNVENPSCSSLKSLCSGLDSRDVSKVLDNFSVGFSISISPTRDQRRFFCWNVQFSLNAYSSSSESSLFCCCTSWRER